MKHLKPTPFLIVFGLLEIILLFLAMYYLLLENQGGMALAGVLSLLIAIPNLILLIIEQAIVKSKNINQKLVWTIEIILIIFLGIYIAIKGISIG